MGKIGVYISGLGQSVHHESVEKYALRFKNELSSSSDDKYILKTEKVFYSQDRESTVVSILKTKTKNEETDGELVYKFYDFKYHEILTEKFNKNNILIKNLTLFWLVVKKIPQLFFRLFKRGSFSRPYLTFYAYFILFLVSLAIIFLIPASIDIVSKFSTTDTFMKFLESNNLDSERIFGFLSPVKKISKWFVPITAFILLIIPESKTLLTSLATEFACVDKYIENGEQSQIILGNLDLLIEFISENEPNSKIHYHSYSFGTIVTLDLLFPIGNIPSTNTRTKSELIITIGTPYEFIDSYYARFYNNRFTTMENALQWLNIYSLADALSTNFRKDTKRGEAEFGIKESTLLPKNINYEITSDKRMSLFNFISMDGIRMHKSYWDTSSSGQSCVRLIFNKMVEQGFITP